MTKLKTRALAPTTAAATVGNNVVSNNEFLTQGKSKGVLDIATVGLTESCNGLTVSNKSGHMDGINSDVTNVVLNSVNKEIATENQTTLGEPPRVQAAQSLHACHMSIYLKTIVWILFLGPVVVSMPSLLEHWSLLLNVESLR
ncbi:uncharacterized protein LOC142523386 isoform X2 [Primulina tabacum]